MVFSVFESNNNFGSLFFVVAGPRMTLAYSIIFVFFLLVGRLYGEQDDPLTIIECPFDVVEEGDRGKDFRLDGRPIESGNIIEGWEIIEFLGVVSPSSLHLLVSPLSSSPSSLFSCSIVVDNLPTNVPSPPPPPPPLPPLSPPSQTRQTKKERDEWERERRERREELCKDDRTKDYFTLKGIQDWLFSLSEAFPELVEVREGGKTEGKNEQPIHHVILTNKTSTKFKKKLLFVHGLHSREWISIALGQGFIHHFLCLSSSLLDEVEIHSFPVANPEGYAYTWETSRLWRKNRKPSSTNPSCIGTDLNRNFPDHWSAAGTSNNPCESIYHGDGPASEAETKAIVEVIRDYGPFIGGIDFHAYGQLIVRPYDYTNTIAPDEPFLKDLSAKMNETIHNVHSRSFTQFPAYNLYPTSGSADGYMYSRCAQHPPSTFPSPSPSPSPFSLRTAALGIELRPTDRPHFLLLSKEIPPSLEEMWPALLLFVSTSISNPLSYPPSPLSSSDVCVCTSSTSFECPSSLLSSPPSSFWLSPWKVMIVVAGLGIVGVIVFVVVMARKQQEERLEVELEDMEGKTYDEEGFEVGEFVDEGIEGEIEAGNIDIGGNIGEFGGNIDKNGGIEVGKIEAGDVEVEGGEGGNMERRREDEFDLEFREEPL